MGHNFLSNVFSKKTGNWFKKTGGNAVNFVKKSSKKAFDFVDEQVSKVTNVLSNPVFIIGAVVIVGGILYVASKR